MLEKSSSSGLGLEESKTHRTLHAAGKKARRSALDQFRLFQTRQSPQNAIPLSSSTYDLYIPPRLQPLPQLLLANHQLRTNLIKTMCPIQKSFQLPITLFHAPSLIYIHCPTTTPTSSPTATITLLPADPLHPPALLLLSRKSIFMHTV